MQPLPMIREDALCHLRSVISSEMSGYRLSHTLAVEEEAAEIAKWYLPQNILEIRAASLLHDITKEYKTQEQIALCERYGVPASADEIAAPKILHAKTAALVIPDRFPQFAREDILDAIAKHTTGAREMSLFAKILYLADYTEKTRTFPDCIRLREFFWSAPIASMTEEERLVHLDRALLLSFEMTIADLVRDGRSVARATREAYDALFCSLNTKK